MNLLTKWILGLIIGGISFYGLAAQPGPHHMGPLFGDGPGMDERHFEKMADRLDLTKEQREKAKKLREERRPKAEKIFEQMKPLHEDLRKLLEAEKVDMAAVRVKLEAIAKLQVEMRLTHIEGRLAFETILTPAQKKKLRAFHAERMKEMQEDGRGPHHNRKGR